MPGEQKLELEPTVMPLVGYRGTFLIIMGFLFAFTGLNALGIVASDQDEMTDLVAFRLPNWIQVAMWWVPATIAFVCAFLKTDWPAFTSLMIAPVAHTASFGWGAIAWATSDGTRGESFAGESVPNYLLVIALVLLAARWPEAPRIKKKETGDGLG